MTKKKETPQPKSSFKRFLALLWMATLLPFIALFFVIMVVINGEMPSFDELENPSSTLATQIYSEDNVLLGKYFFQNRTEVSYEEISPNVINALIATEDERFEDHAGVDFRGLARVIFKTILARQSSAGGGSTITQQLAKLLFKRPSTRGMNPAMKAWTMLQFKIKEWIVAVRLEKSYTKKEILTLYLNQFDFINNAVGIASAANTYFGTTTDSLDLIQSAQLVRMLQNPSLYDPKKFPEKARKGREVVFYQMKKNDLINQEQYDSLRILDIDLSAFKRINHNDGLAPYFREVLRDYLKNWSKDNLKPDGTPYDIYRDGLKIHTTINSKMQIYAEKAVAEHLKEYQKKFFIHWNPKNKSKYNNDPFYKREKELDFIVQNTDVYKKWKKKGLEHDVIWDTLSIPKQMAVFSYEGMVDTLMSSIDSIKYHRMFLQTGFMAMEPQSGFIKAWVGGINHHVFKLDHVNDKVKRQVGSTIKPFLYSLAIDSGMSPCFKIPDVKFTIPKGKYGLLKDWTPNNSTNSYGEILTLKRALAMSKNTVSANLMYQIGPEPLVARMKMMGITSLLEPFPSLCLGTPDISLYEMVGAYSTFANKGVYSQPIFVTRIEDKSGNEIATFAADQVEAMNEETAYVMVEMLKNVVSSGTSLKYRYKVTGDVGGKTGTTNNHSDGWFMGITPDLIAGAWVGCDDPFISFRTLGLGQGGRMALPIWGKFFNSVQNDSTLNVRANASFKKPRRKLTIEMNCGIYDEMQSDSNSSEDDGEFGGEFGG